MKTLQGSDITKSSVEFKTTVLYDDDHIRVIGSPGRTSYTLVTFGPLTSLANGHQFFGDVPVMKLGINCLGFMAKKANWFPADSIVKAAASINSLLKACPEVICYGGSMGGYAAVKYSRLLNAQSVIALCPQWSIAKSECGGVNPGFQEFYTQSMEGMGITSADISGKIYLLYDPGHPRDSFHAKKIVDLSDDVEKISIRSVAHHVINVTSGTSNLEQIISCVRRRDSFALRVLTNRIRRNHHIRAREMCTKALDRHPALLHRLMRSPSNTALLGVDDLASLNGELLSCFISGGHIVEALCVIDRMLSLEICGYRKEVLRKYSYTLRHDCKYGNKNVITHHGTIVAYDALKGVMVHVAKDALKKSALIFPVFLKKYFNKVVMFVAVDGVDHMVQVSRKSQVRLGNESGADIDLKTLIMVEEKDGFLIPSHFGFYVTARLNGTFLFARKVIKDWERFKYAG